MSVEDAKVEQNDVPLWLSEEVLADLPEEEREKWRDAVKGGPEGIETYLKNYPENPNRLWVNQNSQTKKLIWLIEKNLLPALIYLVETDNLDPCAIWHGGSALSMAVIYNRLKIARYFLDKGANPNSQSDDRSLPLWYATRRSNNRDLVKLLIEKGADPNARNSGQHSRGYGAIHIESTLLEIDWYQFLIDECGVNPYLHNGSYQTLFDQVLYFPQDTEHKKNLIKFLITNYGYNPETIYVPSNLFNLPNKLDPYKAVSLEELKGLYQEYRLANEKKLDALNRKIAGVPAAEVLRPLITLLASPTTEDNYLAQKKAEQFMEAFVKNGSPSLSRLYHQLEKNIPNKQQPDQAAAAKEDQENTDAFTSALKKTLKNLAKKIANAKKIFDSADFHNPKEACHDFLVLLREDSSILKFVLPSNKHQAADASNEVLGKHIARDLDKFKLLLARLDDHFVTTLRSSRHTENIKADFLVLMKRLIKYSGIKDHGTHKALLDQYTKGKTMQYGMGSRLAVAWQFFSPSQQTFSPHSQSTRMQASDQKKQTDREKKLADLKEKAGPKIVHAMWRLFGLMERVTDEKNCLAQEKAEQFINQLIQRGNFSLPQFQQEIDQHLALQAAMPEKEKDPFFVPILKKIQNDLEKAEAQNADDKFGLENPRYVQMRKLS